MIHIQVDTSACSKELLSKPQKVEAELQRNASEISTTIIDNTKPLTPILTGELRDSAYLLSDYRWKGGDGYYYMDIEYSALNERTGFNYAEIQHETKSYRHPRGGEVYYLDKGMNKSFDRVKSLLEWNIRRGLRR